MVVNVNSTVRLFADDTRLYLIVDNPADAARRLNSDMERMYQWAERWLVKFNAKKSEALLITRKTNRLIHPTLFMNNEPIKEVSHHKHLGIFLSSDGTWHEHINNITSKAWKRINIMRKLKFLLDRKSLEIIYFSFIRPLLEYADVVWDNCTLYEVNALEKIQLEAASIVTGTTKLVALEMLYKETGWETLETRRSKHKLCLFYKMNNNIYPDYLSSLVPEPVVNTVTYGLRNASNMHQPFSRTQHYYKSFIPSSIRLWNDLSPEKRDAPSVLSFRYQLNKNIQKPPLHFSVGDRFSQIQHTRLRTSCSSLNHHLSSKNIVNDPHCQCGLVETTKHYLLHCQRYTQLRLVMRNEISRYCTPSLNCLLFGDEHLNYNCNMAIFTAVQKYIYDTKRFKS